MQQPAHSTAEGLYNCFECAMAYISIEESWKLKMVSLGCNGTNENLGKKNGLQAFSKKKVPWVICFWCLSHLLELSIKDTLVLHIH